MSDPIDLFDGFEPMHGMPSVRQLDLAPIIQRARRLLHARTNEQVQSAASTIEWMIEEYFDVCKEKEIALQCSASGTLWRYLPLGVEPSDASIRWLFENGLSTDARAELSYPTPENTSDVDALRECISSYVIGSDEEFINAKEYEYFAALSLRLVAYCLRQLREEQDSFNKNWAAECAIQAMDAVCHAEHLLAMEKQENKLRELSERIRALQGEHAAVRNQLEQTQQLIDQRVDEKVKERISINSSRAAIRRHAESRGMREFAVEYYMQNKHCFKSIEAAARAIAGKVVNAEHRTVAGWISRHLRSQSARRP